MTSSRKPRADAAPDIAPDAGYEGVRQALLGLAADVMDLLAIGKVSCIPAHKAEQVLAAIGCLSTATRLAHERAMAERVEGLREAARMVAAKSDLLRGTRGGVNKACFELDLTTKDLQDRAAKIVGLKITVSDDRDDARQAMQVILSSVENLKRVVGRGLEADVVRITRNIERLDAALGRIDVALAKKNR